MTREELGVYDLRSSQLVEKVQFDGLSLVVPSAEGVVEQENDQVAHAIRLYKGKLFLLVSSRTCRYSSFLTRVATR